MVHTIRVFDGDIEITNKEVGEIISCHLEEQTILIKGIRSISKEEGEIRIPLYPASAMLSPSLRVIFRLSHIFERSKPALLN